MRIGPRISAGRRRSGAFGYAGGANPSPASPISASKWRIKMLTNYGGSGNVSASEIEMRATVGGADQCAGGTAISSGDFSGSYQAAYAFNDNGTANYWVSNGGMPGAWIGYDFGTPVTVVEIAYLSRPGGTNECPSTGTVEYWDGAAWQVAWDLTQYGLWTDGVYKILRQPSTGTRWRVRATAASGGGVLGFAELQMRTTVGGADQCSGGDPFADSYYSMAGTWKPSNGFDDNTSTDWATGGAAVGAWLGYDFMAQKEILEIAVTARGGADGISGGVTLSFERWNVATRTWNVVWTDSAASWSGYATKVFTRPPA